MELKLEIKKGDVEKALLEWAKTQIPSSNMRKMVSLENAKIEGIAEECIITLDLTNR